MVVACLVWYETGEDSPWLTFVDTSLLSDASIQKKLENDEEMLVDPDDWENAQAEGEVDTFPISVNKTCEVWLRR